MARGPSRRLEALVLDRTRLGESDLIVTLLAEDGAILRAVAKGARRPGNRLASLTELYGRIDVLLAPGASLWIATDGRRLHPPARMGEDLVALAGAAALAEALRLCVPEGEEDPFVYALALRTFDVVATLASPSSIELVVAAAVLKLLSRLGWRPEFERCAACGSEEVAWLSTSAGGVLCGDCAAALGDEAAELDGRLLAWLRALIALRLDDLAAAPIDAAMARRLATFARDWTSYHLDARLRAFDILLAL